MHFLYILRNIQGWHYIGTAEDVSARFARHTRGAVKSTKGHRPLEVVYTETFPDKATALKREIFLKRTAKARLELFEKIDKPSSSSG